MSAVEAHKLRYLENFIDKLSRTEYLIDAKANKIRYNDRSTLADFINNGIGSYTNARDVDGL